MIGNPHLLAFIYFPRAYHEWLPKVVCVEHVDFCLCNLQETK